MIDFQLAPFIIAGLLMVTGYMFTRWLSNLDELRRWKDLVNGLDITIVAMREEGCAAMGALENIFNGVTAGGMPYSKLVRKIADVATNALVMCAPCGHKALALDNEGRIEHAIRRAENWEQIADRLADENIVARTNMENWQTVATNASGRADEAERLLGLANDRLIVLQSERVDSTPCYEWGDVPEADD